MKPWQKFSRGRSSEGLSGGDQSAPPTNKQIAYLRDLGVTEANLLGISKLQASRMIKTFVPPPPKEEWERKLREELEKDKHGKKRKKWKRRDYRP